MVFEGDLALRMSLCPGKQLQELLLLRGAFTFNCCECQHPSPRYRRFNTKEFVASRDDERGVLILSQFAGAARELHEALIVNPYHIEEVAEALHRALSMPPEEQRERMVSLRQLVREFNVYRWAGRMLLDASRVRQRERISARIGETQGVT